MALNNTPTTDGYTDATTALFAYGRQSFAVQVNNASVFYKLGIVGPGGHDVVWEGDEHFTVPAFLSFRDPVSEGFPENSKFGGIRLRSGAAGVSANVTVL